MSVRPTAVRLEGVSRRFGRHIALRRASVELEAGEITALLGPNGAGKTTLMSLLATLIQPTRGQIRVTLEDRQRAKTAEVDLNTLAERSRAFVGLVSHASLIYDDLTGRENLELFAQLYGLSPEAAKHRSQSLLEQLGLLGAEERLVSGYSRGMRQRLSIARALIQDPTMVLLDEPFTGLDRAGCRLLYGLLRELREAGCLVVIITHDLDLPSGLIDRVVLLARGTVVRDERLDPEQRLAAWYESALEAIGGSHADASGAAAVPSAATPPAADAAAGERESHTPASSKGRRNVRSSGRVGRGASERSAARRPSSVSTRRALRQVRLLLGKDLLTELRTRDTVVMLLFFSLLLVVIFAFSFMSTDELALAVTPGVLWVSAAFTGVLGIERSFTREQEGRTLTALVLVPGVSRGLYAAKMAINILYMALVEAFVLPVSLGMLKTTMTLQQVGLVALAMALGTIGFAAVGTVFSAMLVA
ncbi:MAG: ATP-binding cassette domain-containing protein, partial [Myxococcota bacterium]